jgi:hypothetical protein
MEPARPRAEEQGSSGPRAGRLQDYALTLLVRQSVALLFELHVNAAASGVDSNAVLRGRNADYHTGLI